MSGVGPVERTRGHSRFEGVWWKFLRKQLLICPSMSRRYGDYDFSTISGVTSAINRGANAVHLNYWADDIPEAEVELLIRSVEQSQTLSHLAVNGIVGNGGGDELAEKMCKCLETSLSLRHLDLCKNRIGNDGAFALAAAMKTNVRLSALILGNNNIGDEGAKALARALEKCTVLTWLDLSDNNIRAKGTKELARALEKCMALTTLDLSINWIGAEGAKALARALKKRTALTTLDLSGNNILTKGTKALARALEKCTALTRLDLSGNNIGDEGAKALARALKKCTALTTLLLSHNGIKDEGANALALALERCTALTTLELTGNRIDVEGRLILTRAYLLNPAPLLVVKGFGSLFDLFGGLYSVYSTADADNAAFKVRIRLERDQGSRVLLPLIDAWDKQRANGLKPTRVPWLVVSRGRDDIEAFIQADEGCDLNKEPVPRLVVSIVGAANSGKTSLCETLYNPDFFSRRAPDRKGNPSSATVGAGSACLVRGFWWARGL
jgi:Ran GTPase-activating protein (RanGAP) involved in mRNA processing and transport